MNLVIVSPTARRLLGTILIAYLLLLAFIASYIIYVGVQLAFFSEFDPDSIFDFFFASIQVPFGTDFGPILVIVAGAAPITLTTLSKEIVRGPLPRVSNNLSRLGKWAIGLMAVDALGFFCAVLFINFVTDRFIDELGKAEIVESVRTLSIAAIYSLIVYLIDILGVKS